MNEANHARKILFIGLDSGEPELLIKWAREGVLPNLRELLRLGACCDVTAPRGFGNGVLWPSLCTGVGPATHGRYYINQLRPGSYDIAAFQEDSDMCREPFWKLISDAGRRVGVIDMVRAPLIAGLNGFQIADWLTHDATSPVRSWPAELAGEITARLGVDPLGGNADIYSKDGTKYLELRDMLRRRIDTKTRLTREYLEQDAHDLLITVYAEAHDIGHQCWHLHDPSHVTHDAAFARRHGDPLKDVYMALDAAVGELLASKSDNTTVVLFSGPGMESGYTGNHLLDSILRRLDGLDRARQPNVLDTLKAAYKKLVPYHLRSKIHNRRGALRAAANADERRMRRFFQVPHNQNSGAIRINLEGREPQGRVSAREYDAVCDELISDLRRIINVDTGQPMVAEVIKVRENCHGPCLDHLPDLLVVWHRPAPIVTVESPRIGRLTKHYGGLRTGDHTPNCMLLVSGPGIAPGRLAAAIPAEAIAPTVAELLGVFLPMGDAPSCLATLMDSAARAD